MKEKKINIARPRHSNEVLQSTARTRTDAGSWWVSLDVVTIGVSCPGSLQPGTGGTS